MNDVLNFLKSLKNQIEVLTRGKSNCKQLACLFLSINLKLGKEESGADSKSDQASVVDLESYILKLF